QVAGSSPAGVIRANRKKCHPEGATATEGSRDAETIVEPRSFAALRMTRGPGNSNCPVAARRLVCDFMRIQFCGADRTVTGSCHLIEINGLRVLRGVGVYQGARDVRRRLNTWLHRDAIAV